MLLIALSETAAITKITALTTVAFTVCHYINYHNGSDRLLQRIHISEYFMILNKEENDKTVTKPNLLMGLNKLLAV